MKLNPRRTQPINRLLRQEHLRIAILACALLALAACQGSNPGESVPISFDDLPGSFAVGQRTDVVYADDTRNREITATFWYPTDGENLGPEATTEEAPLRDGRQKFPLVVLIHGIVDNAPGTWPYLAPHLASKGYIVAAPSTGSNFSNTSDLVNHPGDVSFLIDVVAGANELEAMFAGRTDLEKVAVGGFSFGGGATHLIAYDPPSQDPRIGAAIIMAGIPGAAPPQNPELSLLAIYGTEDPLIPHQVGVDLYDAASAPKYLLTLLGGGHLGFTRSDETFDGATMEQKRQEKLTRVAVFAFLTSLFADAETDQVAARQYLQTDFNRENADADIVFDPSGVE